MANSLLVQLGFSADKQSISGTVSGIGKIESAVSDLQQKIKQTFAIAAVHTFASGIKSLGNSSFSGCQNLEKIELSEKLSSIGRKAFEHCLV